MRLDWSRSARSRSFADCEGSAGSPERFHDDTPGWARRCCKERRDEGAFSPAVHDEIGARSELAAEVLGKSVRVALDRPDEMLPIREVAKRDTDRGGRLRRQADPIGRLDDCELGRRVGAGPRLQRLVHAETNAGGVIGKNADRRAARQPAIDAGDGEVESSEAFEIVRSVRVLADPGDHRNIDAAGVSDRCADIGRASAGARPGVGRSVDDNDRATWLRSRRELQDIVEAGVAGDCDAGHARAASSSSREVTLPR